MAHRSALPEADRQRARFQENDRVTFGKRPPRTGKILRINRTTATVLCPDEPRPYRVAFAQLCSLAAPRDHRIQRLDDAYRLAHTLLDKHQLPQWSFRFDTSARRAGSCAFSTQQITLSFHLACHGTDREIRDTLLHEIAHALVGATHHHDAVWKAKAKEIGGSGERCHSLHLAPPRYQVRCENHCWTHTAQRRNPRLICRTCGGNLIYTAYRPA